MILFETERLYVRRYRSDDEESFFRINGDEEVVRFIRPVKSRTESNAFLHENIKVYKEGSVIGRFAACEKRTDKLIGTFSFLYLSGETDFHLGYALLREEWGKGYATELTKQGIAYFFEKTAHGGVYAITATENSASQNVLLKSGFIKKEPTENYGKAIDLFYKERNPKV
jgi:ribosomal-protein-alanine N-acetyltransferase